MKRFDRIILGVVAALIVFTLPAGAEVNGPGGTKFSGFVDIISQFKDNRSTDDRKFTYFASELELDIEKDFSGKAFLRADFDVVAAADTSIYSGREGNMGDYINVYIEQMHLDIPMGGVFVLKAGKFNAPIGYESLDAPDRMAVSHNLLFYNDEPTNLTGAMLTASPVEGFDISVLSFNGFDQSVNPDISKGFGGGLSFSTDPFSFGTMYLASEESRDDALNGGIGQAWTHLLVTYATITAVKNVFIGLQVDYRRDQDVALAGSEMKNTDGLGFSGTLNLTKGDWIGTARYDVYQDGLGKNQPGHVYQGDRSLNNALTGYLAYAITDGVRVGGEYRWDRWDMGDADETTHTVSLQLVGTY